ncbi:MAG: TIR domain-containing protein [Cyclobacteriaceae bacterium]|nr:TIR domain-containing protein [Cyclobacteriaceae bacterium]
MPPTYSYHAFLSHSVDDKIGIATELDAALKEKGLKIWYSSRDLSVGDSITERINSGLKQCRFGIVIISPSFLDKFWGPYELTMLLNKTEGEKKILPILYNISKDELAVRAPMIADIFAIEARHGIPYVVEKLYHVIQEANILIKEKPSKSKTPGLIAVGALLLTAVLALSYFYFGRQQHLSDNLIQQTIEKRISELQQVADAEKERLIHTVGSKEVEATAIKKLFTDFQNAHSHYRNEYELNSGLQSIHSRKNVERIAAIDLESISPLNDYNLTTPIIFGFESSTASANRQEKYAYYNTQPITYTITSSDHEEQQHTVTVTYKNPIRLIQTTLIFPSKSQDTKRHQMIITAVPVSETYSFSFNEKDWQMTKIE